MKRTIPARWLLFLLAMGMILSLAACSRGDPSEPDETSSSEPEESSEPPIEGALERPALADKIAEGVRRNSDTVGWIRIPGTTIDDAVVQYSDNSYYLRLNEDKKYDVFGCYFMDYESRQGRSAEMSKNNIIYGHSDLRDNRDGKKFSQLFLYTEKETGLDFLREHPYIFYSTRDEEMTWQIFAVFYTHVSLDYIRADPDAARFATVVDEAKLRSEYIIDVPVTAGDKILTLSTCTVKYNPSDHNNYRLVIMAKLLPAGKQLAPAVEAEINPDPKKS